MGRHHALREGGAGQDQVHLQGLATDLDLMTAAQRVAGAVRTPLDRLLRVGLYAHVDRDLGPVRWGLVEGHAGAGKAWKANSPGPVER